MYFSYISGFDSQTKPMGHFPLYWSASLICMQLLTKEALPVGATAINSYFVTYFYPTNWYCFYLMLFTQDWAGLDSTMSSSRSAKLQPLQKMAEMQEFLEFIAQEGNVRGKLCLDIAPLFLVINKWRTCTLQVLLLEGTRLVDLFLFFRELFKYKCSGIDV